MFVDLVDSEDVLKAVRTRGPMIPMDIRKFLGKGDSITIGAALSTLSSKNLVYATSVRMGSSSFYYVRGQENKLELLNKYLNDKDKRVFELLRQEKVLKDSNQEPLVRVSLRNIPDFAKKVELSYNGEVIVFWRWFLVREEDAIKLIRGEIQKKDLSSNPSPFASSNQFQADQTQQGQYHQHQNASQSQIQAQTNNQTRSDQQSDDQNIQHHSQNQTGSSNQKNFQESAPKTSTTDSGSGVKSQNVSAQQTPRSGGQASVSAEKVSVSDEQKTISEDIPDFDDAFFRQLKSFFNKNNINLKQAVMIRKNSDYEFVVELNTPFGATEYFCKAKSKKKCNEGDLSSAYLQGQNKRMPTVFITTGEITKKAKAKAKDEYKGLLVKEL